MDGNMRVLVLEGQLGSLRVACSYLRGEGHAVETTDSLNDRTLHAVTSEYDVIVIDVTLPDSEGWSVLADLRRRSKSAPVLLLTSSDEPADRVKGLDAGADDCLVSPFALSELGARLRALVRRSGVSPQTVINIGDLSINKNSRTVTLNGNPVGLTAKEYALLELLAVNRNELVTRSMIYQHVFDEYDPSVANSVDVYISKIRQKIGRSFIKTCRGKGYIID